MAPRHPCPNCGAIRIGEKATCQECRFPKHTKYPERNSAAKTIIHPPLQFHIRTLFAVVILAAVACGLTKRWGVDGLWLAMEVLGIFVPVIEFAYYFWVNLSSKNTEAE
jgi:hypothetical protein